MFFLNVLNKRRFTKRRAAVVTARVWQGTKPQPASTGLLLLRELGPNERGPQLRTRGSARHFPLSTKISDDETSSLNGVSKTQFLSLRWGHDKNLRKEVPLNPKTRDRFPLPIGEP